MTIRKLLIPIITLSAIIIFTRCSKGGKNMQPPNSTPEVSISSVSENRSVSGSVFHFRVSMNPASASDVAVNYTTVEGLAKENTDFIPISGTVTIPANSVNGTIDVEITGDSLRKANQNFFVQLSNPQNCTIVTHEATGTIINENGLYLPVDKAGYEAANNYPGYTLVWSDEFDGKQIDQSNWTFETGNNNGWGNNELEYYTDKINNSFVSEGSLIIEARNEKLDNYNYTSARMITKDKKIFTYGRLDIRAKLPKGKGIWPALWLLGNNITSVGWPACGEVDMMELLGHEPNKIYATLHWGSSVGDYQSQGENYVSGSGSFDQQFHVYSMLWEHDSIKMYIDDQLFFSMAQNTVTGSNPFNSNFFFIFNIAVGGNWPGSPDANTTFPQRMFVDYIRVFQP